MGNVHSSTVRTRKKSKMLKSPTTESSPVKASFPEAPNSSPSETDLDVIQVFTTEAPGPELKSSPSNAIVDAFEDSPLKLLPPELRLEIWKAALPARIVKYHQPGTQLCDNPILLVCKESYYEAVGDYKSFKTGSGSIILNPKIDTLFINDARFFSDMASGVVDNQLLASVERIAYPLSKLADLIYESNFTVYERDPHNPRSFNSHPAQHFIIHLFQFTALKTLTLVAATTRNDISVAKLLDLFTSPIAKWPRRRRSQQYPQEVRLMLCSDEHHNWDGAVLLPEEAQVNWQETKKAARKVVREKKASHAFDIEIKGLIEPGH